MASVLSSFFSRDPRNSFLYEIPLIPSLTSKELFLETVSKGGKHTLFGHRTLPSSGILFERHKLTDAQKELFVSWGVYQVLNCLKFLHNEVKIVQNNLRESIFVTASGDWKLTGFQNTRTFSSPQADLNDLAAVIWQIFNGFKSDLSDSRSKTVAVQDLLAECRSVGGFMKNKFVDTLLFLEEFQLKDSSDKQHFFTNLKDSLDIFPEDVAKNKILPKLIQTYEYGDAGSFHRSHHQGQVVGGLEEFACHLKPQVINDSIYGNLVSGFTDTSPAVRESTVKAMVTFAEKLNYHNLNTDLMKYLARLQGGDEQPGIRTNTTICLGKIGCYIDPSHRQRILISAFTRALKDPFPPARMAGVLALSATQQYYSLFEVASKILPALASLTIDPEKQVRDQGFKAIKGFLEKLEKASESPESIPELEAQVKEGGKSSLLSSDKVPQWAGWALKALSGKFYKSSTPPVPTPNTEPVKTSYASTAPTPKPTISTEPTAKPSSSTSRTAAQKTSVPSSKSSGWMICWMAGEI
uniref:Uncharacterized protein n=1 Tax=Ditylenchus dipsaci TaxID=166011 RepID=A0A915D2F9_9BILA